MHSTLIPLRRPLLALMALSAAAAHAGSFGGPSPSPSSFPECLPVAPGSACLLPLKDGDFSRDAEGWTRHGILARRRSDDGNFSMALPVGAGLRQAVYAQTDNTAGGVAYALRFRLRADRAEVKVNASLAMSTDRGEQAIALGSSAITATPGEWQIMDLVVNGKPFAAPAHLLVDITNEGGADSIVEIDDVTLVESPDASAR